jgi:hypothetical protein
MTPCIAPLTDIRFALRELNDLASLAALPDCEALADTEPVAITVLLGSRAASVR